MTLMTADDPEFLTVGQVAALLQCGEKTVRRRIAEGALPAVQVGGQRSPVRVARHELEAWLYGEKADA